MSHSLSVYYLFWLWLGLLLTAAPSGSDPTAGTAATIATISTILPPRQATVFYNNISIDQVSYQQLTLPLLHRIFSEVDEFRATISKRSVSITKKSFSVFTITPGKNCISEDKNNECCLVELKAQIQLEDEEGTPICGNFIDQLDFPGAGIGHFLSEYNQVLIDILQLPPGTVNRVRLTSNGFGHGIDIDEMDKFFGLNLDAYYNHSRLYKAHENYYIRAISGKQYDLKRFYRDHTVNIWFRFGQRNSGNLFALSRKYMREKISAQKNHFPIVHQLVFPTYQKGIHPVLVTVHIRRGDVELAMTDRYVSNSYYIRVIDQIKEYIPKFNLVVVSEGQTSDFRDLLHTYPFAYLMLDRDYIKHMAHLYYSDILVSSKSGFSFVPAEISENVVVAVPFWHTYSRLDSTVFTEPTSGVITNMTYFGDILKHRKFI